MNLRHLNDQTLLSATEKLVTQERELLIDILHHLREIERRRLFSDLGFSSLFSYCTEKLGYSSDQAFRRINAMRLLRDLPMVEQKIQSGAVSLTNASMAQSYFKSQERSDRPLANEVKIELLRDLECKSSREAERILRALDPKSLVEDRVKPLSDDVVEIRFSAPRALEEWDPGREPDRASSKRVDRSPTPSPWAPKVRSISMAIKRRVWRRDQGQCRQCGTSHGLEVDHIRPVALGGESSLENLRLICRTCNQRAAIRQLGLTQMENYLNPN